jgi:hypothetical protein
MIIYQDEHIFYFSCKRLHLLTALIIRKIDGSQLLLLKRSLLDIYQVVLFFRGIIILCRQEPGMR